MQSNDREHPTVQVTLRGDGRRAQQEDRGQAAENLARLVLIELVRDTLDIPALDLSATLTCQTTAIAPGLAM